MSPEFSSLSMVKETFESSSPWARWSRWGSLQWSCQWWFQWRGTWWVTCLKVKDQFLSTVVRHFSMRRLERLLTSFWLHFLPLVLLLLVLVLEGVLLLHVVLLVVTLHNFVLRLQSEVEIKKAGLTRVNIISNTANAIQQRSILYKKQRAWLVANKGTWEHLTTNRVDGLPVSWLFCRDFRFTQL